MTTQSSASTLNATRYENAFSTLKSKGETALIPFTLLGWPNEAQSFDIIKTMIDSGASALELGIAFSDPMADGPVIQEASCEVLASGFKVKDALKLLEKIRNYDAQIPIGLLLYYNLVLSYGLDAWFAKLAEIGVDAAMIVDLPLESVDEVKAIASKHNIALVLMISPLTDKSRIKQTAAQGPVFFYVVSRLGITGTHTDYDSQLTTILDTLKVASNIPACVGFGISKPEHVAQMKQNGADGVIIGSAVIKTIKEAQQAKTDPNKALAEYMLQMKAACAG